MLIFSAVFGENRPEIGAIFVGSFREFREIREVREGVKRGKKFNFSAPKWEEIWGVLGGKF